ncbi:hypothetical protein Ngar_c19520 [Candidatus Nitrososphaera gargensis Ga9.2]|uniref:Uncharacterized protein n=1 Tax=Nitrososphaera gargensis (strain Ga9.2) TaxID=1237085 RepID=K0IN75_NITGG|nr:hypothetical protein [Candidatus Nitrososphaera gargensis]AFU58884.1 hypothetical protein Ngar_c19520 [Candidatus Nitrososphaera gargensis Ga9.2]
MTSNNKTVFNNDDGKNKEKKKLKEIPAIRSINGKLVPVIEVYESFTGWYWFVTERTPDRDNPDECFGLVIGLEKEWGYIDPPAIKAELGSLFWKVHQRDVWSISHIEMVKVEDCAGNSGNDVCPLCNELVTEYQTRYIENERIVHEKCTSDDADNDDVKNADGRMSDNQEAE